MKSECGCNSNAQPNRLEASISRLRAHDGTIGTSMAAATKAGLPLNKLEHALRRLAACDPGLGKTLKTATKAKNPETAGAE